MVATMGGGPQGGAATVFVGGGNMARALIGGLVRDGGSTTPVHVIEPGEPARRSLAGFAGVRAWASAEALLEGAGAGFRPGLVVWAVKPQVFAAAAVPCRPFTAAALHLSVMAGVTSHAIEQATGSARIVRAMPNTPALIGQGIAGLCARPEVDAAGRAAVQALLAPTGQTLWVGEEPLLDAVTALSGSGPAYVFYVIEAMVEAGVQMGLPAPDARRLAEATCAGAAALSMQSEEPVAVLRERVTSPGGTTFAALQSLRTDGVAAAFVRALHAARDRAEELGRGG
jgi:pyrroline-5-carboxylate reductase